jgi:precorrin-6B methylase 2
MVKRISEKFFSFTQHIIFRQIGTKLEVSSLKKLMDSLFIFFEKIGHKFDIISFNYLKMYGELVEKEIKMADISPEDHILVIGCGSLPATSIVLAMKTKAIIVSIDKDHRAIKEASQYIKNHNLENRISLECADGLNYPVKKFDLIFVLYGVKQQKDILKYLANNIGNETRVIIRLTSDICNKILGENTELSRFFGIKDSKRSKSLGSIDSFLLLKKNSN